MLFTAPQTAPATTLPGIIRPQHPHSGQSDEDDYDAAYLDARADDIVGQEADLPLFSPVEKVTKVVTSSELRRLQSVSLKSGRGACSSGIYVR